MAGCRNVQKLDKYVIMFTNTYMGRGFEAAPKALPVSRERFNGKRYKRTPVFLLQKHSPLSL
jgi:hypothetical protein